MVPTSNLFSQFNTEIPVPPPTQRSLLSRELGEVGGYNSVRLTGTSSYWGNVPAPMEHNPPIRWLNKLLHSQHRRWDIGQIGSTAPINRACSQGEVETKAWLKHVEVKGQTEWVYNAALAVEQSEHVYCIISHKKLLYNVVVVIAKQSNWSQYQTRTRKCISCRKCDECCSAKWGWKYVLIKPHSLRQRNVKWLKSSEGIWSLNGV